MQLALLKYWASTEGESEFIGLQKIKLPEKGGFLFKLHRNPLSFRSKSPTLAAVASISSFG